MLIDLYSPFPHYGRHRQNHQQIAKDIICDAVISTKQTYVEALKDKNAFDPLSTEKSIYQNQRRCF